ncbi:MAG TPA: hypothetical protein VGK78_19860 [Nocardioides sp.]|uniref:hypothetical protein n=1 Tax=Nocardioides sp. TaxID=35761 RepID=UPI002F3F17BD
MNKGSKIRLLTAGLCVGAAAAAFTPSTASGAGAVVARGGLVELNASGVHGQVTIIDQDGQLRVDLDAHNLEANGHLEHLHGFGDGTQAHCPDASLAGPDGILSFADGLPAYGPPVITFGHDEIAGSTLAYSRTFDQTMAGQPVSTLGAIHQYVVVVHGMTLPDGTYDETLPVACAVLTTR